MLSPVQLKTQKSALSPMQVFSPSKIYVNVQDGALIPIPHQEANLPSVLVMKTVIFPYGKWLLKNGLKEFKLFICVSERKAGLRRLSWFGNQLSFCFLHCSCRIKNFHNQFKKQIWKRKISLKMYMVSMVIHHYLGQLLTTTSILH